MAAKKGAEKEAKGTKKTKGDGPKRPRSAYILYSSERREALKKEKPDLKSTQIVATLAEEWNALSAGAKEKYQKMALEEKNRYTREKKA